MLGDPHGTITRILANFPSPSTKQCAACHVASKRTLYCPRTRSYANEVAPSQFPSSLCPHHDLQHEMFYSNLLLRVLVERAVYSSLATLSSTVYKLLPPLYEVDGPGMPREEHFLYQTSKHFGDPLVDFPRLICPNVPFLQDFDHVPLLEPFTAQLRLAKAVFPFCDQFVKPKCDFPGAHSSNTLCVVSEQRLDRACSGLLDHGILQGTLQVPQSFLASLFGVQVDVYTTELVPQGE
jgi:hypothetical protein